MLNYWSYAGRRFANIEDATPKCGSVDLNTVLHRFEGLRNLDSVHEEDVDRVQSEARYAYNIQRTI